MVDLDHKLRFEVSVCIASNEQYEEIFYNTSGMSQSEILNNVLEYHLTWT